MNTKSTALTLSLMLAMTGINSACSAADLPAESLVIKGFHLGMSLNEAKEVLASSQHINASDIEESELVDNDSKPSGYIIESGGVEIWSLLAKDHITNMIFSPKAFNADGLDPSTFTENFISSYRISSYVNKIVDFSSLTADTRKSLLEENSFCVVSYKGFSFLTDAVYLHCENKITGLSLRLSDRQTGSGLIIHIKKIKTLNEIKQEQEVAEKKKQETIRNMKMN